MKNFVFIGLTLLLSATSFASRVEFHQDSIPTKNQDRFDWNAHFRIRAEGDFDNEEFQRIRGRIRARIGASYKLTPQLLVSARLSTAAGNDDQNTPYLDFNSDFAQAAIVMDRVFLRYSFLPGKRLDLFVGKFQEPIYRGEIFTEFVWDMDVHPEGIGLAYKEKLIPGWNLDLYGGFYFLSQIQKNNSQYLSRLQMHTAYELSKVLSQKVSVTLHKFSGIKGTSYNTLHHSGGVQNSVVKSSGHGEAEYVYDYNTLQLQTALSWKLNKWPVVLEYTFLRNLSITNNDINSGYYTGIILGPSNPGQFNFYFEYFNLDQDVLFSPYAQDDFGRKVGSKGYILGSNYQVNHFARISASYLANKNLDNSTHVRVRLGVNFTIN